VSDLTSFNPATGEPVGTVPLTPIDQIPAIVARARSAWPAWAARGAAGRADLIRGAADLFVERADELGDLLTAEMGKPLAEGRGEVRSCGGKGLLAELDEMVDALRPEVLQDGRTYTELIHQPFGVAAAITPWNFPISMPHWMVLPSLVAGNTVVLKPSEETPLIAQAYVDLLHTVLPPGVLSVVHGADDQGKALVAADIDLIAFTGSREVGKAILAAAAPGLTRVVLELGGKDPLVVLEDADLVKAARFAVRNSFGNAGQVCVSTERIYVHEAIADEFEAALKHRTSQLRVGNGTDEGVDVGPMISARQRDHVLAQLDDAVAHGARVIAGGEGHHGLWVMPTFLEADHSMDVMKRETFGPVACVVRVRDEDHAVRLANDSPFGLGAVVFGRDEDRAWSVAQRIDAGMVGVNRGVGGAHGSPWVGTKESGYGYHGGRYGHRQFAQARIVSRRSQP
jgi:acyl-CoA reductase-like NAD-dependent aldehyde dehydrogenase